MESNGNKINTEDAATLSAGQKLLLAKKKFERVHGEIQPIFTSCALTYSELLAFRRQFGERSQG